MSPTHTSDPPRDPREPSARPTAADPQLLWQRATRRFLGGLQQTDGTSSEHLRVEEELAALLRDEAEAARLDVEDPAAIDAFLEAQAGRLDELALELREQLETPRAAPGAPSIASNPAAASTGSTGWSTSTRSGTS